MEVAEGVKDKVEDTDKFLRDNILFLMIAGRDAFSISLLLVLLPSPQQPEGEDEDTAGASALPVEREQVDDVQCGGAERNGLPPRGGVRDSAHLPAGGVRREDGAEGGRAAERCEGGGGAEDSGERVRDGKGGGGAGKGPDCMEFKPERWITEEGKVRHVPAYKFMAFNCGPRVCLGKDLALMQIKTVTAAVLWNFEVEVLDAARVGPKNSAMLRMKNGMMVTIKKRKELIQ